MYLFDIFRSFLPLHNPIGFGAVDFIELAIALLLVVLVLVRERIEPFALRLAERPVRCMLALAGLAIVLRLALLPTYPVPIARGADDFSYLLLSDTLAHFRLANPTHPLHEFFETNFVLQQPTYSSIYPIGPALPMALGQIVFHLPWAGVVLATAAFCALCYWMLRGWTTSGWALIGGLIAIAEFGPLSYWTNSYWGGSVSAAAGCLVFGALPRLRDRQRVRDAILLGLGLGLQMLSRPYESLILDLAALAFVFLTPRRFVKVAAVVIVAAMPAVLLFALHNRAVTGSATTMPYMLSRYQYGVPTTFTFQPAPVMPHVHLTANQWLYHDGQTAAHDTAGNFFGRLFRRAAFTRFFLLPPLFLAIPFFLLRLRERRYAWVALALGLFVAGSNFYPYFYPHYVAAAACLVLLVVVIGIERLGRINAMVARWLLILCGAHFLFWYGLHATMDEPVLDALSAYDAWDTIPHGDPDRRIAIARQLDRAPGKQLVFVRYTTGHDYHEWLHNDADIDAARVVMANDFGTAANTVLERYYPGRTPWLLEPDAIPPRMTLYRTPAEAPPTAAAPSTNAPNTNKMTMEQVR